MKKRAFLVAMTLATVALTTNGVRAVDVNTDAGLIDAIKNNAGTINFTSDITIGSSIHELGDTQGSLTIDGGGYSLVGNGSSTMTGLEVTSGHSLNFTNFGNGITIDEQNYTATVDKGITGFTGDLSVITNYSSAGVSITNSTFYGNGQSGGWSAIGGAITNDYGASMDTISGNFVENQVGLMGGAILNSMDATKTKINTISGNFISNYANNGGGAIANLGGYIGDIDGTFMSNNATFGGGAIMLQQTNYYNPITNSIKGRFINNKAFDGGGGGYGGAIFNYEGEIGTIEAEFKQNYSDHYGGAIANYGDIGTIKNSSFSNNEAINYGGAIINFVNIDTIDTVTFTKNTAGSGGGAIINYTDATIEEIINSSFTQNSTNNYGGAIYNAGTINKISADFTNNSNTAGSNGSAFGGAIYNGGTIKELSGSFTGNSAAYGGAIYNNKGTLNIVAKDSDTEFTNNGARGVYNNQGTINLNTAENKNIIFNDVFTGRSSTPGTVNINDTTVFTDLTKGTVQFNDNVSYNYINLYGGTLAIGQNATINQSASNPNDFLANAELYIKGNSILNTINDYVGDVTTVAFEVDSNVDWTYKFDVNLEDVKGDRLISAVNNGNLTVKDLNILKDTDQTSVKIQYADTNVNGSVIDGYQITTSGGTYTITAENDNSGSYLVFNKQMTDCSGLACAVYKESDSYQITLDQNENVDEWISNKNNVSKDMVIAGHDKTITTDNNLDGMIVDSGIKLEINNVTEITGFNNALVNNGELILNNTSIKDNTGSAAITNNSGNVTINATEKDVTIGAGSAHSAITSTDGNIYLQGDKNITISGDVIGNSNSTITINTNTNIEDKLTDFVTLQQNGNVTIGTLDGGDYLLQNGVLTSPNDINTQNFVISGGRLDLQQDLITDSLIINGGQINMLNNSLNEIIAQNTTLNNSMNFIIDADLANKSMDRISSNQVSINGDALINVSGFNYLSDTTEKNLSINFASGAIKDYITTDVNSYMNKLYKYTVAYDKQTGNFNFAVVGGGSDSKSYNPSVMAGPVGAQLGGYLVMLNSFDEAFRNMDMYMLKTQKEREALKLKNKYATANANIVYDPTMKKYENPAGWVRPYATFEKVDLNNGPKVSNVAYGSFFGGESEMYDLGNGWDGMYGFYGGYNGSHQSYQGNSIYQNGGTLGFVSMAYKNNFFTGLTANVGANSGEANTMYGNENFTMFMTGVASKSGYNFELADGKFIIQPNLLMGYSFVNTFDYTNAAGLSIKSDPLHAIHLEPGIKFIGNLKNGWQPYGGVSVVWNIMDKTQFKANDVSLPSVSIDPYVKYGVGVRKSWGEKFTGYFQTYITNGGRNGVGLQAGFRWSLGKEKPTTQKSPTKAIKLKGTKISLNQNK